MAYRDDVYSASTCSCSAASGDMDAEATHRQQEMEAQQQHEGTASEEALEAPIELASADGGSKPQSDGDQEGVEDPDGHEQEPSGEEHPPMVEVALEDDNGKSETLPEPQQVDCAVPLLLSLTIDTAIDPSFVATFPSKSPIGQAISEDLPDSSSDDDLDEGEEADEQEGLEDVEVAAQPPPINPMLSYELSRGVMFNKYANVTPSTQEQQQQAQQCTPSWVAFDSPDASSGLPCDPTHTCHNVACQELMRWKDLRIHELQRALDQMVESMAIQQRDLAAQRALLTRQSEHFTKLSMGLQHEKMTLQLNRERSGGGSRLRTQRSHTSLGIDRTDTPRRGTMPHVRSLPTIPPPSDVSAFKAAVTTRHSMMPTIPLTMLPLDDHPVVELGADKSKSLSALEIRVTTPQMPTIHEMDKLATDDPAPPPLLCEVSLHEREPSTATSTGTSDSSSDLLRGDAPPSTHSSADSAKKWSLGGRLRSIRWKP